MNELDKWAAEQCGIKLIDSLDDLECGDFEGGGKAHWMRGLWTLDDARCREIVREHFHICTNGDDDGWEAEAEFKRFDIKVGKYISIITSGELKTIAEAEIACIKAIYEA